jgi:hypothetical protein
MDSGAHTSSASAASAPGARSARTANLQRTLTRALNPHRTGHVRTGGVPLQRQSAARLLCELADLGASTLIRSAGCVCPSGSLRSGLSPASTRRRGRRDCGPASSLRVRVCSAV